jgi:protein gp37
MAKTNIEWADSVWNPITGCTPVSAGCKNCYAKRMAKRLAGRCGYPEAPHEFDVTVHEDKMDEPLRWRKPRLVFVCSMGDLFHEDVITKHAGMLVDIFAVMALARAHHFLLLTKRPHIAASFFDDLSGNAFRRDVEYVQLSNGLRRVIECERNLTWPLPNVWFGTTAENQARADERIPQLLRIPAAGHFVSYEPALGPVDWDEFLWDYRLPEHSLATSTKIIRPGVKWLIAGGETGPGARPSHPDWFREVRDQCAEAGVPFLLKSLGEWQYGTAVPWNWTHVVHMNSAGERIEPTNGHEFWRVGKKAAGRLLDGVLHDEYPEALTCTGQ